MNVNPFGPNPNGANPPGGGSPPPSGGRGKFTYDFGNKQRIPEGMYPGRVIDVKNTRSKSGNPMLTWDLVITEGEYSGFPLVFFTVITEAASWKLEETLVNLGLGEADSLISFDLDDAINLPCVLEVEHTEYQGRIRESVKTIHPPPPSPAANWASNQGQLPNFSGTNPGTENLSVPPE